MRIVLTGDVMLGRMVDHYVIRDDSIPPFYVWGDVLPEMLQADLRLANLECVISARGEKWRPRTKAFHFRAHPRAVEFLRAARVDCVSLANNHTLDYGPEALEECLALLDGAGIPHVGAGRNVREALEPSILNTPEGPVAMLALTDNEPEWEAGKDRMGTNYVAYYDGGLLEPYRTRVRESIAEARAQADLVVVAAHVGPNWGKPSQAMQALAHEIIDLGAGLYWGHSNHTPQGIEVYKGKPILYAAGDFVDDYAVDHKERNDLSFLFTADVENGRVRGLRLRPTAIEDFRARRASGTEVAFLHERMMALSAELGSRMEAHGEVLELLLPEYRRMTNDE